MPAEDHMFIKRLLAYHHARLTPWGKILFWSAFIGAASASPGTHISAYLLPSFIISLLIVAFVLSLCLRPNVSARRRFPSPSSAGGFLVYKVAVKNLGKRPLRNIAVFEQTLPYGIYPALSHPRFDNAIEWIDPGEEKECTLVMRTPRRGAFELKPLLVGSSFPAGLMRTPVKRGGTETCVVYPKFTTQTQMRVPSRRLFQPGGVKESSQVGDSNEFLSTREFRYGDRLRDVHWPSTARADKLIVKEYVEEYIVRVALICDTEFSRGDTVRGLEGRLSLVAGIADALDHRDCIIDLFTTERNVRDLIIGRSLGHIEQLLESLSFVEGEPQADLSPLLVQIQENVSHFSSVILVLKDIDRKRLHFIRSLRNMGATTRIFVVREKPVTMETDADYRQIRPAEATEGIV